MNFKNKNLKVYFFNLIYYHEQLKKWIGYTKLDKNPAL